jgi:hypothetical protein
MTRKRHKTSSSHSQPYQYKELPQDGSFRYIILHRGTGTDPLRCSLRTAPLSKTKFEAISYVWGKSKKNKKIICDGRIIKITKSLSNVLRRLRLPYRRRKLWADGICINQDDLDEKGHQVAIMGDIYRSAKCVLIWVGSIDYGYGPQLCSLLDDVNRMIDDTCKQIDMSWDSFPYPEENDPILSDSRWTSLFHLFQQDWFKRGWVVREAAFAQYGLVIWHQSEFDWEELMRVYSWQFRRAESQFFALGLHTTSIQSHYDAFRHRNKILDKIFRAEQDYMQQSVLEDLDMARTLKLSDPRDRIYAFVELSEDPKWVGSTQPDYNLAPTEVYRLFTIQYIQVTKSTRALDYVVHGLDVGSVDIPSWVPRWNIVWRSIASRVPNYGVPLSSRDGSFSEPKIMDDEILSVKGVVTDCIRYISDAFEFNTTTQIVSELWKTMSHILEDSPYGSSRRMDAFFDALTLGICYGPWTQWRRWRALFMAYIRVEHGVLATSQQSHHEHLSPDDSSFLEQFLGPIGRKLRGSRFIVTNRGYMGLAPVVAQTGDTCGIIFGCHTPCILRKVAQGKHYKFLGGTYLMGKQGYELAGGSVQFVHPLGHDDSKDWVEWDVEEQDIYLV